MHVLDCTASLETEAFCQFLVPKVFQELQPFKKKKII
jgi:hypothetical protein